MWQILFETESVQCQHIELVNMAWKVWKLFVMKKPHEQVKFRHHLQMITKLMSEFHKIDRSSEIVLWGIQNPNELNRDCRSRRSSWTCWMTAPKNRQWRLTAVDGCGVPQRTRDASRRQLVEPFLNTQIPTGSIDREFIQIETHDTLPFYTLHNIWNHNSKNNSQ